MRRTRGTSQTVAIGFGVTVLMLLGVAPAAAAPGDADATFGGDGIAVTDQVFPDEFGSDGTGIVAQPDGKVVLVGADGSFALVYRFDAAGVLDPTFSGDGKASFRFSGPGSAAIAQSVGIDSAGRIVVAGRVPSRGMGIARLTADGELDPTFSGDGKVVLPTGAQSGAHDLAIDEDDRIVVVGGALSCEGGPHCFEPEGTQMVVGRVTAAGQPDPTFAQSGIRRLNPSTGGDSARAVGLTPNGRILVAGVLGSERGRPSANSVVLRLWPGGRLDRSFGHDGWVRVDLSGGYEEFDGMVVGDDGGTTVVGRAVAGANRLDQLTVARLGPNGGFVGSFSGDGRLRQDLGAGGEIGNGVAVDAEGRIVVGGVLREERPDLRGVVLRYLPSGALDPSFSANGWSPVDATPDRDWGEALALDADGRILLGVRSEAVLAAVRLLAA